MQNALAVLQFPLAPVPAAMPDTPVMPDSPGTTQDFAESFAAELPDVEGETVPADPTATPTDASALWMAPIISVPGLFPVALQATEGVLGVPEEVAVSVEAGVPAETALPDMGQLQVPVTEIRSAVEMVPASFSEDFLSTAGNPIADGTIVAPGPDSSTEGAVLTGKTSTEAALQPGARPVIGSADPSKEGMQPGPSESRAKGWMAAEQTKAAVTLRNAHSDDLPPSTVGKVVSAAMSAADAPGSDMRPTRASIVPEHVVQTAVAQPVAVTVPPLTEPAAEENIQAIPTDVEALAPQAPEGPKGAKQPKVAADPIPALSGASSSPAEVSSEEAPVTEAPVTTSFWERYFTDRSDQQPTSAIPPGQVLQMTADRIAGSMGLVIRPVHGTGDKGGSGSAPEEVSDTREAGREAAPQGPSASATPGPSPSPAARPDPVPVLTVLPWSETLSERPDDGDTALSSVSFLPSVASHGPAHAPGAPLALPVQQVAMQLAAVLVQSSDRATELALAPEELGKVRLRIEADAANPDRLTIIVNVERPETLDLFRRHAGELADAMRNAGYSGAHIDFGGHSHGSGDERPQGGSTSGPDLTLDEIAPTQNSPRRIAGAATLDLRL